MDTHTYASIALVLFLLAGYGWLLRLMWSGGNSTQAPTKQDKANAEALRTRTVYKRPRKA